MTHTHNRPTPQKVVTNSKMQNNADHLISLLTQEIFTISMYIIEERWHILKFL